MDLATLTDEELSLHLAAVLTETERRTRLVAIPEQVTALATEYLGAGGDPADLAAALPA